MNGQHKANKLRGHMAGIENNIVYGGGFKLAESSARDILDMQRSSTDVSNINHTGNPEGVVSANPSSLCHDPVSGSVYKKETGTGNTGWVLLTSSATKNIFCAVMQNPFVFPENSIQNLIFDNILQDTASAWNGVFYVVPVTSPWRVTLTTSIESTAGFINCGVFTAVDPTNFVTVSQSTTSIASPNNCVSSTSIIVSLNAGDLFKACVFSQSVGSTDLTASGYGNGWSNILTLEQL